jgi:hypothetical protein
VPPVIRAVGGERGRLAARARHIGVTRLSMKKDIFSMKTTETFPVMISVSGSIVGGYPATGYSAMTDAAVAFGLLVRQTPA